MQTRNPVEGYFASEFPSVCNHCGIMAAWSKSRDVKHFLKKFLRFFAKTTPYGKIFKILFRKFSSRHRSTCFVQISWSLADGKSVKSCVIYLTKIPLRCPAVATARIAPKICQGQPPTMYSECSRFHPNRFAFGGVIAEHVNTAKTRRKVNIRLKPSFEPNNRNDDSLTLVRFIYFSSYDVNGTLVIICRNNMPTLYLRPIDVPRPASAVSKRT